MRLTERQTTAVQIISISQICLGMGMMPYRTNFGLIFSFFLTTLWIIWTKTNSSCILPDSAKTRIVYSHIKWTFSGILGRIALKYGTVLAFGFYMTGCIISCVLASLQSVSFIVVCMFQYNTCQMEFGQCMCKASFGDFPMEGFSGESCEKLSDSIQVIKNDWTFLGVYLLNWILDLVGSVVCCTICCCGQSQRYSEIDQDGIHHIGGRQSGNEGRNQAGTPSPNPHVYPHDHGDQFAARHRFPHRQEDSSRTGNPHIPTNETQSWQQYSYGPQYYPKFPYFYGPQFPAGYPFPPAQPNTPETGNPEENNHGTNQYPTENEPRTNQDPSENQLRSSKNPEEKELVANEVPKQPERNVAERPGDISHEANKYPEDTYITLEANQNIGHTSYEADKNIEDTSHQTYPNAEDIARS